MSTNNPDELQSQLIKAYKELESKQPQVALARLERVQLKWQENSDIKHLMALTHKSLGDLAESRKHFLQCLEINPKQPEVHNNLANLLKSQERFYEAEEHYLQALLLHPNYLQAQRNLAICYQAQTKYKDAIMAYNKVLELSASDASAINGIADCWRLLGDLKTAHQTYKTAVAVDPQRFKSWHNMGVNFHLQGQLNEAIECYQKAYKLAPNISEVAESLASALYESGEVKAAIDVLTLALNANPDNVILHERLNSMLWETEFKHLYCDSYVTAMSSLSNNQDIALSYAMMLYRAGETEQAKNIIDNTGLTVSDKANVLSLRGEIEAELGDLDTAYRLLSASLEQSFTNAVARQMVKIDIILERYTNAQTLLEAMFSDAPHCQLTWGLQSLVWRLCEDARYCWLCDYDNFIKTYQLPVPPEYESLDSFLKAIRDELMPMHRNEHEPLEQTLRHGTQTAARLLHSSNLVLQALKESLKTILTSYIDSLPDDIEHPFLSRKSGEFEFSGSWSVKLRPNGFHVNHVHTDGWISSSCYISIPPNMSHSEDPQQHYSGHIKFGESPLQLGKREKIELRIEPKPGMVVLFPSYFWHGTYSFKGEQADFRLTAPFDVTPL